MKSTKTITKVTTIDRHAPVANSKSKSKSKEKVVADDPPTMKRHRLRHTGVISDRDLDRAFRISQINRANADAESKRFSTMLKRGRFIMLDDVVPIVEEQFSILRAAFASLHRSLPSMLVGRNDQEIQVFLYRAINEAFKSSLSVDKVMEKAKKVASTEYQKKVF